MNKATKTFNAHTVNPDGARVDGAIAGTRDHMIRDLTIVGKGCGFRPPYRLPVAEWFTKPSNRKSRTPPCLMLLLNEWIDL